MPAPLQTDHDWRAFFDLQEKIERHIPLGGNPVDSAVNHLLRRFGQVPVFGVIDSLVWKELLTSEQIKLGMRLADAPGHEARETKLRDMALRLRQMTDEEFAQWMEDERAERWIASHRGRRFESLWVLAAAVAVGVGLPVTLGFIVYVVSRWFR